MGPPRASWEVLREKKYNIKQVQLANVGNIQTQIVPVKNIYLKSWIYKFNHDIGHKITIILSNLGIIPKIDFRFVRNLLTK